MDVPWFESRHRLEMSPPKLPDLIWDHLASYSMGTEVLCRGIKRPGPEVNSSPPSSAAVKNDWSYTSIPPIRLPGVDTDTYFTVVVAPIVGYVASSYSHYMYLFSSITDVLLNF